MSPNSSLEMRGFLLNTLGIKVVDKPEIYLGADLGFSRRKGEIFHRVLDRIGCRLANWKKNYFENPFGERGVLSSLSNMRVGSLIDWRSFQWHEPLLRRCFLPTLLLEF